jgi:hypothetical protein
MLIVLLLLPPVLLFGLALGLMWVPLPQPFPELLSADRSLIAAVTTGILGLGYLISVGFYVVARFRKASQGMDPIFTEKGLMPGPYMLFGRRYTGFINQIPVDVNFLPGRGVQRDLLNIYLTVNIGIRFAIATGKTLLDCRDCPQIMVEYPEFNGLRIFSNDGTWLNNLLKISLVRTHLSNIMEDQSVKGLREVYFMPGKIWLRALPTSRVMAGDITEWLDSLTILARIVDEIEN